jgi:hypothetical protein
LFAALLCKNFNLSRRSLFDMFALQRFGALAVLLLAETASAAVILQNGSFEITGAALPSGLFQAANWTNNSGLPIQASSAPAGFEGTFGSAVTGSRYLRLASDNPDPGNTGFIVQNMGTMVAGETYTITGDLLGGSSAALSFSILAQLTSDGGLHPATVYASQTTAGLAVGAVAMGGLSLSYTATGADDGQSLFLWLRAQPSGLGQAVRGGVDNLLLQTTAVPEPGTLGRLVAGLCFAGMLRRKR